MPAKILKLILAAMVLTGCDKHGEPNLGEGVSGYNEPVSIAPQKSSRVRKRSSAREKIRADLETVKGSQGNSKAAVLEEIARRAMVSAPELLGELLEEIPKESPVRNAVIEDYISSLAEEEKYDEISRWAEALPDPEDYDFAKTVLVIALAEKYPDEAAARLKFSDFNARQVDPVAEQVVQNWVSKNPDEAVKWANKLPSGEARRAGFSVIFTSWVASDPQRAFAWAGSQQNPTMRDEAVSAVVNEIKGVPDPIRLTLLDHADPVLRDEVRARLEAMSEEDGLTPKPEFEIAPENQSEPE